MRFARPIMSAVALSAFITTIAVAQDRLASMPGYAQYSRVQPQIQQAVKSGAVNAQWSPDSKTFDYVFDGKRWRFDVAAKKASDAPPPVAAPPDGRGGRGGVGGVPDRGRQFESALSPDNSTLALYRNRNLFVTTASDTGGKNATAITTEGDVKTRVKYGTASWVYGEELNQVTAMWWSPDSKKLGYYRFDESKVPDYFLQLDQTNLYSTIDTEAYPKAGESNPIVDLFVYDRDTKKSVKLDIRDGKPFDPAVVGYYTYNVRWSPDGSELLVNRTNRRQNIMELAACSPSTTKCRVVIREEWPTGWVENDPPMDWLADNKRFLWTSERNGFANVYLYDLTGKLLATVTNNQFELVSIVRVDEAAGMLWYTARDGDNFMKVQLHRVKLDGTGDVRLTDPAFNHRVSVSPDGKFFTDVMETHDKAPVTKLVDVATKQAVATVAESDLTRFKELGLRTVESFTFTSADGKTPLSGTISFPSNFDPSKKYPIFMSVYMGPDFGSNVPTESFTLPAPTSEFGFLVVKVHTRSSPGMGKRVLDGVYLKLGTAEIDDLAAGVRSLFDRPYVDRTKVGIEGTSYGGYAAAMAILRYPDVFSAAVAQSPVTDWRHYDTIYTERYMWIPQENKAGYDAGAAMPYARNLKGNLMIYYGTADNNVHPNNSMQLIAALQAAGKHFEVQVGPDQGHSAVNPRRMVEFMIENLIMR